MEKLLFAWLGRTDLKAVEGDRESGDGPILQGVRGGSFDRLVLLSNFPSNDTKSYIGWLSSKMPVEVRAFDIKLTAPTFHNEIFKAVDNVIGDIKKSEWGSADFYFHLSPGTPAMSSVWLLLSKTKYPAKLIETSREMGYREVSVPFDITAEFVPDFVKASNELLKDLNLEKAPSFAEFSKIVHKSPQMKRVIQRALKVAPRDVPVLIEGESGTGKELFARAIHRSSGRKDGPFIPVNCGAIPEDLIESELFGHKKGSFTGASTDRRGHFEMANGGTLFLDEIGELPLKAQVKLLRVLQQGEVTPIGSSHPVKINVRIVSATNRNLSHEISKSAFREDLFYRLAVAVLSLPPLRDRSGDIGLLVDYILAQINAEYDGQPGYHHKKISASAKNLIINHNWPGNIRELQNTLRRAAIWSDGPAINDSDLTESFVPSAQTNQNELLEKQVGEGFNLQDFLGKIAGHYLEKALQESGGNKTKAAKLVGLPNYQTFTNWAERYKVKT